MNDDRDDNALAAGGWAFLMMLCVMSVLWAPVALVALVASRLGRLGKGPREHAHAGFRERPSH